MKNRLLLLLAFFLTTSHLFAEDKPIKLGCVKLYYVLEHMPESRQMEVDLKAFELQSRNQLNQKLIGLQEKVNALQQGAATMTEEVKKKKQAELQQVHMELEAFQAEQQDVLAKKQMELLQPILDKIQKTIALVAKENKYTHVVNRDMLSIFSNVLYTEPEYDLSNLVLKKLGIDPTKLVVAKEEKKETVNAKPTQTKKQETSKRYELSCGTKTTQLPDASQPVARVHNKYLYKQDIAGLLTADKKDSVKLIEGYVDQWLIQQLLADKAEKHCPSQLREIEKKVADFRSTLMVNAYLEKMVQKKLEKQQLSEDEIHQYYQANQESFKLRHNIVKGKFLIIPKNAPHTIKLKNLLISKRPEDMEALQAYCATFAKDYLLDDTIWLKWDDIVTKTPFHKVPDRTRLLKRTAFTEIHDEMYRYYFNIEAYKTIHQPAPLALVRTQIVDILHYKQKVDLINQIKHDILQQAKNTNEVIIYE
eukprot:gene743-921_t